MGQCCNGAVVPSSVTDVQPWAKRRLVDKPALQRMRHGFQTIVRAKLPDDVMEMVAQGLRRNVLLSCDAGGIVSGGPAMHGTARYFT